jgi:hypothetical protein
MSKAAELAALIGSQSALSNRNMIINGAMQVAQRGTSFSSITANVYPVDRFFVRDVNSAAGEATVSQSTTTPDDFKNSLKIDVTTADTSLVAADQYKIEYRAEGQDVAHLNWGTSAAKAVTLSFWIRSNKTGNTQVAVLNSDNNRAYVATFSISAADTWERKELTIDGDTSGTWLTTNGIGLRLRWGSYGSTYQTSSVNQWVGSQVMSRDDSPINFFDSTDNELYLTGVQLEIGEQATPFEHRSFGDELAACQRYYQKTFAYATVPAQNLDTYSGSIMGVARSVTSTSAWEPCGTWDLAVSMRATPSIVSFNPYVANAEWGNSSAVSSSNFRILASTADRISCDNTGNTVNFGSNNPAIQLTAEAEL